MSLAYAFIAAGIVKILGERFASGLSIIHPMGAYLEALHHTGYYYTFIGVFQILAAILLLIPRTVIIGALIYFPIILNIFILSFAVRFEGSLVTAPLMVLANLYILVWHYDRLKYLLPINKLPNYRPFVKPKKYNNKFPFIFSAIVIASIILTIALGQFGFEVMPRNSLSDCKAQFESKNNRVAGFQFCECIHVSGESLDDCLEEFENYKKRN